MWKLTKLEQNVPDGGGGGGTTGEGPVTPRSGKTAVVTAAAFAGAELALRAVAGRAATVERTRAGQAAREAGRLTAKHGATSAPATAAAARATARRVEASYAKVAAARAAVPIVTAAADAAVFHGRVVDGKHDGVAGVDVEVRVDARTVVKTTTDRDGYYRVDVPVAAAAPPGRIPIVGARPSAARLIAARGSRSLTRDGVELTVAAGRVAYRELVVDDDGPVR